tara:strand:- start:40 stop:222 length:183 start_codon:yes stop_codon:yes gene_type:complete
MGEYKMGLYFNEKTTTLMMKVIKVERLITRLASDRYSKWSVDYWCNVRKELRLKMMKGIN